MLLLYNILATLLWPLLYLYPPFKGTVRQRLGRFELGDYDPDGTVLRILINAVSAGEVVAITSFITELRHLQPGCQIALLTTTDSGQEIARKKLAGQLDLLAYFPLIDLPFAARRYLDRLKPHLYITTEAEVWPNIQSECRRRGIPVVLANARIYLHNKRGIRGWVVRKLYELVDLLICQDELQRERFLKFGVPAARLAVSGNIKFDFALDRWERQRTDKEKARLGLAGRRVIVAGSTHEGEEQAVLTALKALLGRFPDLALMLAPRHIERAGEVAALASQHVFATKPYSAASGSCDVVVVDKYGVLTDCYQLAEVVVLGGTFHPKVGGHNILEATALGRPVICGPHTYGIVSQLEMLKQANGVVCVDSVEALGAALGNLLERPEAAAALGQAALQATLANRGAARRAAEAALSLVAVASASLPVSSS